MIRWSPVAGHSAECRHIVSKSLFRKRSEKIVKTNQNDKDHDQPDIKRLKISSPEVSLSQSRWKRTLTLAPRLAVKKRPARKAFVSSFIRTLHAIAIDENQNELCSFEEKTNTSFPLVSYSIKLKMGFFHHMKFILLSSSSIVRCGYLMYLNAQRI